MANAHDLLMAQRAAMMGGKSLPYLRRVAYLESTGTQWIDFGKTPRQCGHFEVELSLQEFKTAYPVGHFFGAHPGSFRIVVESQWSSRYGLGEQNGGAVHYIDLNYSQSRFDKFRLDFAAKEWSVNDGEFSYSYWNMYVCDYNYIIGAFNFQGTIQPVKCRYKSFRCGATEDMADIDMIPVLDLSGRPCMYNQAQSSAPADDPSRFFYNQGTGEFTWGELDAA